MLHGHGESIGSIFRKGGLRREVNVGADAAGARLVRQGLGVDAVVGARGADVAAKVGARVAAVAVLAAEALVRARAHGRVADEHAEALGTRRVSTTMAS